MKDDKNDMKALSDVIWSGEVFRKGSEPSRQWNSSMVPPKINAAGMHLNRICRCSSVIDGDHMCSCFGSEMALVTKTLYLSMNDLDNVEGIERFRHLRSLSLSDNFLLKVPRQLKHLVELRRLNIAGNPFEELYWKDKVVFMCPRLMELDGTRIAADDRDHSIRNYRQACMLWNVVGLVKALLGMDGVGLLSQLRNDVCQRLGLDEGEDTIEYFYCAVKQAMDGCQAVVDVEHDGEYPCVRATCADMVMSCVEMWNDIECQGLDVGDFDLLEPLEKLRDAWEKGDAVLEHIVLEIWSQFYTCSLMSDNRSLDDDQASLDTVPLFDEEDEGEEEEEEEQRRHEELSEEVAKMEDTIAEYARLLDEKGVIVNRIKSENEDLKQNISSLQSKYESEVEVIRKLRMDKEEISFVLRGMQHSLEETKHREAALQEVTKRMKHELEEKIVERDALEQDYEELKRLQQVVSDEAARRMKKQANHLMDMEQELDGLRRQPIVPLSISIVSPNITDVLETKDMHLAMLQRRVDDLEIQNTRLEQSDAFRMRWNDIYLQMGVERSFKAWRILCQRNSAMIVFEERLAELYLRKQKQLVFDLLLLARKRAMRMHDMATQKNKQMMSAMVTVWKRYAYTCRMVKDLARTREGRLQQHAFKAMFDHCTASKQRMHCNSEKAVLFHQALNQKKALYGLISAWRKSVLENASKLEEHAHHTTRVLLRRCLLPWKELAQESRMHAKGDLMYRKRVLAVSFKTMQEHASRELHLRAATTKIQHHCAINTVQMAWNHWKHTVQISQYNRAAYLKQKLRHALDIWRREAKENIQARALLWQYLTHWRVHVWDEFRRKYAAQQEHNNNLLLYHYFVQWKLSRMSTKLEEANTAVQAKDQHLQHLTSLCNSSSIAHRARERAFRKQSTRLKKEVRQALADTAKHRREADETISKQDAHISQLTLRLRAAESIKTSALTRAQLSQKENRILHSIMTA